VTQPLENTATQNDAPFRNLPLPIERCICSSVTLWWTHFL